MQAFKIEKYISRTRYQRNGNPDSYEYRWRVTLSGTDQGNFSTRKAARAFVAQYGADILKGS